LVVADVGQKKAPGDSERRAPFRLQMSLDDGDDLGKVDSQLFQRL
jgi:hypothetical protein